ncbi:MAG: class I SAM-dependent methyltransferase [Nanoarchaeota archaeon]
MSEKVTAIKVDLKDIQSARQCIMEHDLSHPDYSMAKKEGIAYLPIKKDVSSSMFENMDVEIVQSDPEMFPSDKRPPTVKEILQDRLTSQEMEYLKTSFDTIGTIAIIEIDPELEAKEKIIGQAILQAVPAIETVVKKIGRHQGEFRTQKVAVIAGEDTKEAVYKENGITLKLNVEEVYFSPRLSTERKRISQLVEEGERILVMFSGCAPYPCVLAKNTEAEHITGVEINPVGHRYGEENVRRNNISNVTLHNGDVRDVVPTLEQTYDRILMPLPKSAEDFLDIALGAARKGTIIHMYDFLNEEEFHLAHEKIAKACTKAGKEFTILDTIKCGQHAPHVFRLCVDFRIESN